MTYLTRAVRASLAEIESPDRLCAMDDAAFVGYVSDVIHSDAKREIWDALMQPDVCLRTQSALVQMSIDIQNALTARRADLAAKHPQHTAADRDAKRGYGDWRRRALRAKAGIDVRLRSVKAAAKKANALPDDVVTNNNVAWSALIELSRAVSEHQAQIMAGNDDDSTDDTLWRTLKDISVFYKGVETPLADVLSQMSAR